MAEKSLIRTVYSVLLNGFLIRCCRLPQPPLSPPPNHNLSRSVAPTAAAAAEHWAAIKMPGEFRMVIPALFHRASCIACVNQHGHILAAAAGA